MEFEGAIGVQKYSSPSPDAKKVWLNHYEATKLGEARWLAGEFPEGGGTSEGLDGMWG